MFRYRLEPVLRYRKMKEEERRRSFSMANRRYLEDEAEVERLKKERESAIKKMGGRIGGLTGAGEMIVYDNYLKGAAEDIGKAGGKAQGTRQIMEMERERLLEKVKERRIIEAHKSALERRYDIEQARRERAMFDEIALMRFIRERAVSKTQE
ncbi:MAG: flagellar export protein FliJ [Candidatus Nitrospinota bacterium M3_3B_026]